MTASPTETRAPSAFRDLIALWPRTRDFARDAGCSPLLVRQWRHRNFVPPQYWRGIVAGAARRQIGDVDVEVLARLAAALRGPVAHPVAKSPPAKIPASRQEESR